MTLLKVENLSVDFPTPDGLVAAVHETSFEIKPGETLAIVGESGSGKTVTNLALMGLIPARTANISGSAKFESHDGPIDLISMDRNELRKYRGKDIAMIFQDPMSSLHPYYKIGNQLAEAYLVHNPGKKKEAMARAIEMLDLVGIPEPAKRAVEFPHQFSGGMRQRVMIAMALMNSPQILIADEPTTALDVTVQAQILALLSKLKKEFNMGILLITHDLGVVAQVADRVNVMYAGRIVEEGPVDDIFYSPLAPYTLGLLKSVPRVSSKNERLKAIPGQPPSLINLPVGCPFAPRCEYKQHSSESGCNSTKPELIGTSATHRSRCHIPESLRHDLFAKELKELQA